MFERFTQQARAVLERARFEARALDHPSIGTSHVLLGILSTPESAASRVLSELGVDADSVRADLVARPGPEGQPAKWAGFTPDAKIALEQALRAALHLKQNFIGTEHVLLGMLEVPQCSAVRLLRSRGIDLDAVRSRAGTVAEHTVVEMWAAESERLAARVQRIEGALAPMCPTCHAALEETGAFRRLRIPSEDGAETVEVRVIFCRACGTAIAGSM